MLKDYRITDVHKRLGDRRQE